jgi:hypothetical protein
MHKVPPPPVDGSKTIAQLKKKKHIPSKASEPLLPEILKQTASAPLVIRLAVETKERKAFEVRQE